MKIDKEIIESVLSDYTEIDPNTRIKIINHIEREAQENKPERVKRPKKFHIAVAITDNEDFQNVPVFVLEMEEGEDHNTIIDRITGAAVEYNLTPKGRKFPVSTIGGAIETVKTKLFKEKGIKVTSKSPLIIVTKDDNNLDLEQYSDISE